MVMSTGIEELERSGHYLSAPAGSSMEPLFHHKNNVVEIVKAEHPLKKHDLTLHVGDDGQGVLHRIMEIGDGYYMICGDNCLTPEKIPFDKVVGRGVRFYRKGRWIPVENRRYRMYVGVWCGLFPVRKYLLKVHRAIGRAEADGTARR